MATGYRKCPDCEQDVLKTANECKNCGYSFVGTGSAPGEEEARYAKIEVYTPQFRMVGSIILGGSGFDFRLSDFLNTKAQRFFPLLDTEIFHLTGQSLGRQDVVMVNKESIRLLIPLEEPENHESRLEGIVSSTTHRWR